jgi:hypothetical protein
MQVNKIILTRDEVLNAYEHAIGNGGAARFLNLDLRTFKKEAVRLGLYNTTHRKKRTALRYSLIDILNGKHPQYPTTHLSKRLVKEGYKEYKCEICGINSWNNKKISLELNHKDGNNGNHFISNLELIYPNCHSQTSTYRNKNRKGR